MNREELQRYVGVTGYSLGQVEKDYFQHIILAALSRKMSSFLVFKGGTALQKTGLIPRFSEDLDFTALGKLSLEQIEKIVLNAIESYNSSCELDHFIDDERTLGFRIKIQGPLYRNRRGLCTIRIEASKREELLASPQPREINPPYSDILPYVINIMQFEEMAAEKIRALYTRNKARDLYDLYKLIESGAEIRTDLVNSKLEYYKKTFEPAVFLERCKALSKKWESELTSLMEYVPPKEKAYELIGKSMTQIKK